MFPPGIIIYKKRAAVAALNILFYTNHYASGFDNSDSFFANC